MAMVHARAMAHHPARRRARPGVIVPTVLLAGFIVLALGFVAWILWPRWPSTPVSLDAPSLPISVGDVTFNVPPAAIRRAVQRKPGTQPRIDLVYLWPELTPPDPADKPGAVPVEHALDRIFVTIAATDGTTLAPPERVQTIYPRYLETSIGAAPGGLAKRPFRADTPYQGEELIFDFDAPERFTVRCTRGTSAGTPGMCLYDQRIGGADLTLRFPRDWLSNWRDVQQGLEQIIAGLRGRAG
jgi:hypothetical protein